MLWNNNKPPEMQREGGGMWRLGRVAMAPPNFFFFFVGARTHHESTVLATRLGCHTSTPWCGISGESQLPQHESQEGCTPIRMHIGPLRRRCCARETRGRDRRSKK